MAVWYIADVSEDGRKTFLDCNRGFHDYRIAQIRTDETQMTADLLLQYDAYRGVLLRFFGVNGMRIPPERPEDIWIAGASLAQAEDGLLIWYDCEEFDYRNENDREKILRDACWIRAEKLIWAVTDPEGNPVEMPEDRLDQTWEDYAVTTHYHFEPIPYEDE